MNEDEQQLHRQFLADQLAALADEYAAAPHPIGWLHDWYREWFASSWWGRIVIRMLTMTRGGGE